MDVNGTDYQVLRLVGKGKGGYCYLVTDGKEEYILKQIHHEPCDYFTFGDKLASELQDYERLRSLGIPMPKLLAVDEKQERLLKEYLPGKTVYDMVAAGEEVVRWVRQVEAMCEKLYPANWNIDYFPTNFIPRDGVLYYVDYECSPYTDRWNFQNWGMRYWSQTKEFMAHQAGKEHVL
jgi:tRNA A-37 threonylcarbamoyl transferase component Bud32